jgi:hypothetical protein
MESDKKEKEADGERHHVAVGYADTIAIGARFVDSDLLGDPLQYHYLHHHE